MRRSISLSPIRTESGANLRTANWTRLKFRNPNQQQHRNYNNYGNQHHHNRGYHNQRYQNRGRGYYRNQNFTTTRYIPKRRYSSNRRDGSRSRSRSYSRSPSRDRSQSRSRDSRSRSRSLSKHSPSHDRELSQSYSPEPKNTRERLTSNKSAVKTEAASYYSSAQSQKNEIEFPEKVATDLNRWGSPGGYSSTFQSSANKKMQEQLDKNADAEEMQEKLKKTALESIARHEKSLHKIKLEQSKKLDSDSGQSEDEYEVLTQKKKKKGKKKKLKVTKVPKKKPKAQKVKVVQVSESDSSNSESSDEKSSDVDSSSSGTPPPPKKSKSSKKKKANKDDGANVKTPVQQQPAFFPFPQGAVTQGAASQPVMMMAPNMASGDMKFINPYGQPVNMIKFEMPGPDGKMMQFMQIPSMPQGAMQPVVMAQPVGAMPQQVQQVSKSVPQPVPQPVAAPAKVDPPQPSHLKVVPIKEDAELLAAESAAKDKDLTEKQKRRKEVMRTRLWPRPANSRSPNESDDKSLEQGGSQNSEPQQDWPMKDHDGTEKVAERDGDYIPGLSPLHSQTKSDPPEMQGQKIPTVGGASKYTPTEPAEEEKDEEVEEEEVVIFESYEDEPASSAPTTSITPASNPPGLVAYPQIVQGFTPVFSNQPVAQADNQSGRAEAHDGKRQENRWSAATEEFIRLGEKSQPSSDGEVSSSSDDEAEKYAKIRRGNEGKRAPKGKSGSMKEDEMKKAKKKKKNKKERKMSVGSEESPSPMKDKKRKKKKKNKDKDVEEISDSDSKMSKRSNVKIQVEQVEGKKKKKDGLERGIPQELPLSHIRGLVNRRSGEGSRSIFAHVNFGKVKKPAKSLREVHDTYEDQFVSLFHEETAEATESPLNMSRSALKKIKIRPQGTRSVTHMTKITLCERIALMGLKDKFSADKSASQKVSVNLASLSSVEQEFQKPHSPSRSPSRSSKSPSKSPSRSRSSKSMSRSRSPRRYRSKSHSSYSSRSRSRSLPKAYTVEDDRGRDDDRRMYRRDGNRYHNQNYNQQQHHQRYNPQHRYQNRGRGNWHNYNNRGNRGNYYNNRGNYNNRGYHNRNRGYYNNNNNYNNRQQWRPNYNRDRRDSDRGDRSFERRSYTRSPERRRASSYSSDGSDRRERSVERNDYHKTEPKDARNVIENKQAGGKLHKSPVHWTHDKYDEADEMKSE